MVLNGKVDITIDVFGITIERMEAMDFLPLLNGGNGRLYIRNPRDSRVDKVR